jgi:Ferritin-like domain
VIVAVVDLCKQLSIRDARRTATLGLPDTTYQRITEIWDNEAGHLRLFQDSISATSSKPGSCRYDYGWTSAQEWLALQNTIEVSSMVFATGLAQSALLKSTVSALVGIGESETRHEVGTVLIHPLIFVANHLSVVGPHRHLEPRPLRRAHRHHLLLRERDPLRHDVQLRCPRQLPPRKPRIPVPSQHLPQLFYNGTTSTGHPGSPIEFVFVGSYPDFKAGKDYYAVFNHGAQNITVPFDVKTNSSVIPDKFESGKGIIISVIADEVGAPTLDNVLARPLVLLQQLSSLTDIAAKGAGL